MRKKRGYSRETPKELLRDYKLFAIACEGGKREPEYFNLLKFISGRVSVDVIGDSVSDEEVETVQVHKSAPKWVLDRAMRYIEKEGLSDEDELWFVLDKDRWSDVQIREIFEFCEQRPNWNIVVSNPCFEVWLYFHKKIDINVSKSRLCNDFKQEISTFNRGGYHPLRYIGEISVATENVRLADNDTRHFMPDHKRTKVYKLIESMMSFVGVNDYQLFIADTLPSLIKTEQKKIEASKKIKRAD